MNSSGQPPGRAGSLALVAVAVALFAWGAWECVSLARAMMAPRAEARVIRATEGRARHWKTTVLVGGRECSLDDFHAEPGERIQVLVDPGDPARCLPIAFFPTGYRPLAILVFGALSLGAGLSGLRRADR